MTLFSPRCEYTRVYPYVCVCVCVHAYVCGCLHAALCFWKAIFSTVTVIFGSSIFSSGFPSTSLSVHRLSLFLLVRTLHLESQVPSHFWLIAGGVFWLFPCLHIDPFRWRFEKRGCTQRCFWQLHAYTKTVQLHVINLSFTLARSAFAVWDRNMQWLHYAVVLLSDGGLKHTFSSLFHQL